MTHVHPRRRSNSWKINSRIVAFSLCHYQNFFCVSVANIFELITMYMGCSVLPHIKATPLKKFRCEVHHYGRPRFGEAFFSSRDPNPCLSLVTVTQATLDGALRWAVPPSTKSTGNKFHWYLAHVTRIVVSCNDVIHSWPISGPAVLVFSFIKNKANGAHIC